MLFKVNLNDSQTQTSCCIKSKVEQKHYQDKFYSNFVDR